MIELPTSATIPDTRTKPDPRPKKHPRFKKIILTSVAIFFSVILITVTIGYFFVYRPALNIYAQSQSFISEIDKLKTTVSDKDLQAAKVEIENLKTKINIVADSIEKFSYLKNLPYLKYYYSDSQHLITIGRLALDTGNIIIQAIEPYQDFLGLKGSATDSNQTTQDRITFLSQSVESLVPYLDTIEANILEIKNNLDDIDVNRYPETVRNYPIRSTIQKAKETLTEAHDLIKNGKPILAKTSWFLGQDKPRNYFLIFQNNAELRPTGGFWTAYGTLKVDKGKITPGISDDIYSLDALYNSTVPAPRPIKAYHINVPYWNLRDLNISPDFPESISLFMEKYYKITGTKEKFDAVIALDTQVLVDLVEVLGRIGVPGWGNFSAEPDKRCDGCPQIIYQLEWIAGRPRNYIETDRKGFLGPLMHSLLSNAMGSEKNKIGPLAEAALKSILQKHVLFYFTDPDIEAAAVAANITGSITQTSENTDYFHLNDANMSSAKTNLFLRQKIKHEIISHEGKIEHKITVTYINPSKASNCNLEKGDLCLNAPKYRNWFRFYVPAGSEFVKMTGSEVEPVIYDELSKTVFEGFYGNKYPLYAQTSAKTSIQYVSSVTPSADYTLYLQKQPGTKAVNYDLWVNGQQYDTFDWVSDKIIKLSL